MYSSVIDWLQSPKVAPWWRIMRMDRPIGTLLLLWPTLTALWLASDGLPSIKNILVFSIGALVMRSAGCVINDYADRKIDAHVERTAHRPLATGEMRAGQAIFLFVLLLCVAFALVLTTNTLTVQLAFVGAGLAFCYPFMKRFTQLPQLVLGLAMNWGVVMAYAAESGQLSQEIFVFYAATIAWTVAYDTFYAMVDRDDDLRIGVKSIAILFGENDRLMILILQGLCTLALLLTGARFELGLAWYIAVASVAALFFYQYRLTADRSKPHCFAAFVNNNWVGVVFFTGAVIDSFITHFPFMP